MNKIPAVCLAVILIFFCSLSFGQEQVLAPNCNDGDLWTFKIVGNSAVNRSDEVNGQYTIRCEGESRS